jgi:DNA invertase Pin-like site-specific DNA recombinase
MQLGYLRISKADGSQALDLQRDALLAAGVAAEQLYHDLASGKRDDRPGLAACLKALRQGDLLVAWKLDRLGRDLRHLVNLVHELTTRGVGLKILTGQGATIDTTASGKLVFGIFAALAEFERALIIERTRAGLASARARGRQGGRPSVLTPDKVQVAREMYRSGKYTVASIATTLGVSRASIYRHLDITSHPKETCV